MNTIFKKIIDKEIPCYKIYEDEDTLAFLDINPESDGHTLVIPKKYYLDIESIDEEITIKLLKTVLKVKAIIEKKLLPDGITLIQNNGDVQEVKHLHIHIKPYYKNSTKIKDIKEIFDILTSN